ncbi:MAG TPA: hypothetical protein DCS93_27525 [Microscillaceae bacterium]|nr:hypothetical protein [Microscillaceae bacterium]
MKVKYSIGLLMLLYLPLTTLAQTENPVDSLKQLLQKKTVTDKQKVQIYAQIARKLFATKEVDTFITQGINLAAKIKDSIGLADVQYFKGWAYITQGAYDKATQAFYHNLALTQKIGYKKGTANAYNGLGSNELMQSKYAEAQKFLLKSLQLNKELGDSQGLVSNYGNLGLVFQNQGDYMKALAFQQKAIDASPIPEEHIYAYANMGWVYLALGNYTKALEVLQKALKICKQFNDRSNMADCYENIGIIYYYQGYYAKALEFQKKSLKVGQQIGNPSNVMIAYQNIGNIYTYTRDYAQAETYQRKALAIAQRISSKPYISTSFLNLGKLEILRKNFPKAKELFKKALAIQQEIGAKDLSAEAYINLGIAYNALKNTPSAITYLEKGVKIASKTGNVRSVRDGAQYLSQIYAANGAYQKAYHNNALFKQMSDSLLNIEGIINITHLEDQYLSKKREDSLRFEQAKEKAILQKDIHQRKITQTATLTGLVLSMLLLFTLFQFYRNKQKSNEQLRNAHEIIQLTHQHTVESITYAKRIQQAVLPLEARVSQCLPNHFVLNRPRDVVSGDFYWFESFETYQVVVVADCTGHGVPGAFMTLLGSAAINDIVVNKGVRMPHEILNQLEQALANLLHSDSTDVHDGMDVVVCAIDRKRQLLHFSGAKNPLIIIQNDELKSIKGDRRSINAAYFEGNSHAPFQLHTVDISEPTTIYMYSDGYQDQFGGPKGKKFMRKQLHETLAYASKLPVNQQQQLLENTLDQWMDGKEQIDDILVMGIQLNMEEPSFV